MKFGIQREGKGKGKGKGRKGKGGRGKDGRLHFVFNSVGREYFIAQAEKV
jgi:hypothetical protein